MTFTSRTTRRLLMTAIATMALALVSTPIAAQAYPNKAIRVLIPAPPGGGTDALGRLISEALASSLKQPVVPENKPGAGGVIATDTLAKSPADGYTLMITQNGHTMNPAMFKTLPYDTLADFTAIAPVARAPLIMISGAGTGVASARDVAELGKIQPARMTIAVSEASTRIAATMIGEAIGAPVTIVNYKGTGPGVVDVMGGHVNFSVTTIASTLAQKSSGKIGFVGVLATERSPFLPDVPTMQEQGYPGLEAGAWYGVIGPANMPADVVKTINAAVRAALTSPAVQQKFASFAVVPWSGSPEDLNQFIRKEVPATISMARKAGIQAE